MNNYQDETLTADELEAIQTEQDEVLDQEQDVKAGYIHPRELAGTENPDNIYFGKAQSFVFLQIWLSDDRYWIPLQTDLKTNWADRMVGSETDYKIEMPDGSFVVVTGSSQCMEAFDLTGKTLAKISAETN